MFKDLRLSIKILVVVLAIGVIPFCIIGVTSLIKSTGNLTMQVFSQLESMREIKKAQIEAFFKERERDLNILVDVVEKFRSHEFPDEGALEEDEFYAKYIDEYDYYDLFLIHPEGKVLYSVTQESDYGTNIVRGKYASSGLGKLVRKVISTRQFGIADFEPYAPSNNEPAAFIAQPIIHSNNLELIVALQLSIEAIDKIMQQRPGMGRTGETYLVGKDKLMRSDSFLDPVNHSIRASFAHPEKGSVDTEASREALAGRTGESIITDYNGNPVLSAYTPVKLWDVTWALIAEMDVAEAFESIHSLTWLIATVAVISILSIIAVILLIVLIFLQRSKVVPQKNEEPLPSTD